MKNIKPGMVVQVVRNNCSAHTPLPDDLWDDLASRRACPLLEAGDLITVAKIKGEDIVYDVTGNWTNCIPIKDVSANGDFVKPEPLKPEGGEFCQALHKELTVVLTQQRKIDKGFASKMATNAINSALTRVAQQTSMACVRKSVEEALIEFYNESNKKIQECPTGNFIGTQIAFPKGTKLCYESSEKVVLAIEHEPMVRTISAGYNYHNKPSYQVAFPYMVFFLTFKKVGTKYRWCEPFRVAYKKEPLTGDADDILYKPNLPNFRDLTCTCFNYWPGDSTDLKTQIQKAIEVFWASEFTYDGGNTYGIKNNLDEWERKTKENALFVLKHKWQKSPYNLGTLVENMKNERPSGGAAEENLTQLRGVWEKICAKMTQKVKEKLKEL
jgi:hypothetical protein